MYVGVGALCAVVGFNVGALALLLVHRSPMRMRLRVPAQHCHQCGTKLDGVQKDALRARMGRVNACAECGQRLWNRWPWFELLMALAWGATGLAVGWRASLPLLLVFAFVAVTLAVIDIRHHLLPSRIIYGALFATFVCVVGFAVARGDWSPLIGAGVATAGAWLAFFLLWWAYPKGMGFGDVRLSAWLGLTTGWLGIENTFVALFCGVLLGAVGGIASVLLRRTGMKDPIPYGPFLLAGAALSLYFGQDLVSGI